MDRRVFMGEYLPFRNKSALPWLDHARPRAAWRRRWRWMRAVGDKWGGGNAEDRPDRGGQRAEYEALPRPPGSAWLPDRRHPQRHRGARSGAQIPARSDFDGYPAAGSLRPRSDQMAQG